MLDRRSMVWFLVANAIMAVVAFSCGVQFGLQNVTPAVTHRVMLEYPGPCDR